MISADENTIQIAKPAALRNASRLATDHRKMSALKRREASSARLLAKRESARNGPSPLTTDKKQTTSQSTIDIFRLAQNELFGVYLDPTMKTAPGGREATPFRGVSGLKRTGTSIDDLRRKNHEDEIPVVGLANGGLPGMIPTEGFNQNSALGLYKKIQKDKAAFKNWTEGMGTKENGAGFASGRSTRKSGRTPLGYVPEERVPNEVGQFRESPIRAGLRAQPSPPGKRSPGVATGYDVTHENEAVRQNSYDNPRYVIPATRGQARLSHPGSVSRELQLVEQQYQQQYQQLQHQFQQQRQQYQQQQQRQNHPHRKQQQQQQQQQQQRQQRQQKPPHELPVTIKDLADATAGLRKPSTDRRQLKAKLDVNVLQDIVGGGSQPRHAARRIPRLNSINYCDREKTDLIITWLKQMDEFEPEDDAVSLLDCEDGTEDENELVIV